MASLWEFNSIIFDLGSREEQEMKSSGNSIRVALMISSIILLIVLQVFWLRSSYENAFVGLKRETSTLLRSTIFSLRDSLFIRNIEAVDKDHTRLDTIVHPYDSIRFRTFRKDTLAGMGIRDHSSNIQVFVSATGEMDSVAQYLTPLASNMHRFKDGRKFVIRIGPDTLALQTLSEQYKAALRESGMEIPFVLKHISIPPPDPKGRNIGFIDDAEIPEKFSRQSVFRDTLQTDRVRMNPFHIYLGLFPNMHWNVIKEISPQVLFSLLLTIITISSFVIMHRNLKAQQKLMDIKNDFISNVTHELKTPVATVSVALEALKDFHVLENRDRTKEYLTIAQNELNRLTLMTDKILKASVFESQGVSFISTPVQLDKVVAHVIDSMKVVFDSKSLRVNYFKSGPDFKFQGSEFHMINVMFNLVDNAVKYSHKNSAIDIELRNTGVSLELLIRDHGIGIDKEFHEKIFEKFFRVPTGDVHNTKGYGLGLNYVSAVVKSLHGSIKLESFPGEGSCFKITLPIDASH